MGSSGRVSWHGNWPAPAPRGALPGSTDFRHPAMQLCRDGVTLISLHILAASAHSSSSSSLPIMSSMDVPHQLVRLLITVTVISIPIRLPKLLPMNSEQNKTDRITSCRQCFRMGPLFRHAYKVFKKFRPTLALQLTIGLITSAKYTHFLMLPLSSGAVLANLEGKGTPLLTFPSLSVSFLPLMLYSVLTPHSLGTLHFAVLPIRWT